MANLLSRLSVSELFAHRLSSPRKHWDAARLVGASVLLAVLLGTSLFSFGSNASLRKQKARDQFEKAEQMREALNGRPQAERTRRDYQRVADAYRKVYYVAPDSSKADASVVAVAELLAEMGRQFQPGEKDLNAAIHEYEFLRREYPGSKYRFQAMFTIGQIYKEDLGDDEAARKTFDEFVAHYPRNSLAPQAKKALAELNRPKPAKKPVEEARIEPPISATEDAAQPNAQKKPGLPMVTGIRHWSTPDYTRVAIDVDREVKYEAGRVSNPDRIFFDLPDTKLASVLVGKSFDVQDGFLKKIRVAQYQPGYTRVVLEVADVSDYSAFLLPNPYRLIIDIHGHQTQTQVAGANPPRGRDDDDFAPAATPKSSSSAGGASGAQASMSATDSAAKKKPSSDRKLEKGSDVAGNDTPPTARTAVSRQAPAGSSSRKVIVDEDDDSVLTVPSVASSPKTSVSAGKSNSKPGSTMTARITSSDDSLLSAVDDTKSPELKATTQPTSAPTAVEVAPRPKAAKKAAKTNPTEALPTHEAVPTSAGERSLTRTLGLKIGRIVIDAGHGGHDTGTIGPNGLMEKDLV
ncbi:MAG: AMIN domain-containing protein, partial [Candidatus Korobacteraceae bacterium]